jgi:hypothetical protein
MFGMIGFTRKMGMLIAALVMCSAPVLVLAGQSARASLSPPSASTGQASDVTSSSATLTGSTYPSNQQTEYYFQYGQTAAYGLQTPTTAAGTGKLTIHVSTAVTGLSAYTAYHYRLVAVNATGTTDGQDRTFTTKKVPLTFKISPLSKGIFGRAFSVSGTLAGTGSGNRPVILQASPFPFLGGFKDIGASGVTDAAGNFSLSTGDLTRNTQFRVSTLEQPAVKSSVVLARVAVRVTLHVQGAGRPGFARFFGTVTPGQPGALVLVQRLSVGSRPSSIGGVLITSRDRSGSRFSRTLRIRRPGFYRVDVQVVSGAQTSNHSRPVLVN